MPAYRTQTPSSFAYELMRLYGGRALNRLTGSPFLDDALSFNAPHSAGSLSQAISKSVLLPTWFRRARLIFVHVPKTGGTSVGSAIYGRSTRHLTAKAIHALDPNFFLDTPSFAIIRNPITRASSSYAHIRAGGGEQNKLHPCSVKELSGITTFDHFLDYLRSHIDLDRKIDYVLRPQCDFVLGIDGEIIVDEIFKFDNIDTDIASYLRFHGVNQIPHLNRGIGDVPRPTRSQISRLEMIFSRDFGIYEAAR